MVLSFSNTGHQSTAGLGTQPLLCCGISCTLRNVQVLSLGRVPQSHHNHLTESSPPTGVITGPQCTNCRDHLSKDGHSWCSQNLLKSMVILSTWNTLAPFTLITGPSWPSSYRWRNWGTERLNDSVSGAGFKSRLSAFRISTHLLRWHFLEGNRLIFCSPAEARAVKSQDKIKETSKVSKV